jgi:hypothetical protein
VTPSNLREERARLSRDLERRGRLVPRFAYLPVSRRDVRRALEGLERRVAEVVDAGLVEVYRARIEELALEARIAEASGTELLGELALARFAEKGAAMRRRASELAADWLRIPPVPAEATMESEDRDPRSLLSQMRAEVGRRQLPFRVEVSASLSSRAATGERTIWIASGKWLTAEETRRTVVHEVLGHAVPRAHAAMRTPIFSIGTARGSDDQEGLALLAEDRAGLLDDARRRELAARHWSVLCMSEGASFADVVRALITDHGFSREAVLGIAERAFRGSDGRGAGLGRERVYLGAWQRVREHLGRRPEDEDVLASGQVALDAVPSLSRLVEGAMATPAPASSPGRTSA